MTGRQGGRSSPTGGGGARAGAALFGGAGGRAGRAKVSEPRPLKLHTPRPPKCLSDCYSFLGRRTGRELAPPVPLLPWQVARLRCLLVRRAGAWHVQPVPGGDASADAAATASAMGLGGMSDPGQLLLLSRPAVARVLQELAEHGVGRVALSTEVRTPYTVHTCTALFCILCRQSERP